MHEKLLWTNDNIQYLFHGNIMEYDMVAASLSVSKRFQLLDNDTIEQLNLLPKKERTKRKRKSLKTAELSLTTFSQECRKVSLKSLT